VTPRALVVGLGQPAAGDDGVGIAVVVRLRAEGVLEGVAYETAAEASALVERLQTGVPVIIVDALVGSGKPGDVVVLDAERLAGDVRPLSTHGISVAQAIVLARALAPAAVSPMIRVVGIVIATAEVGDAALSPRIAAAVPKACAKVHELIREVMN
jgi:hydrogenase maturation protease